MLRMILHGEPAGICKHVTVLFPTVFWMENAQTYLYDIYFLCL
jgi:hypothetical protein